MEDDSKITDSVKSIEGLIENWTPNDDGSCKSDGCKGYVVRRVVGLLDGRYMYDVPECNKCSRRYPHAMNAPRVGERRYDNLFEACTTI